MIKIIKKVRENLANFFSPKDIKYASICLGVLVIISVALVMLDIIYIAYAFQPTISILVFISGFFPVSKIPNRNGISFDYLFLIFLLINWVVWILIVKLIRRIATKVSSEPSVLQVVLFIILLFGFGPFSFSCGSDIKDMVVDSYHCSISGDKPECLICKYPSIGTTFFEFSKPGDINLPEFYYISLISLGLLDYYLALFLGEFIQKRIKKTK